MRGVGPRVARYESAVRNRKRGGEMTFGLYLVGFIILIVGLALGAYLVHVPALWIGVGVIILVGLGVMMGVATTRQRDPSN